MALYHVNVSNVNTGFVEVKAESEEEALAIAEDILYGTVGSEIHWTSGDFSINGVMEFPEAWTAGIDFLEVRKNGSDESVQGS